MCILFSIISNICNWHTTFAICCNTWSWRLCSFHVVIGGEISILETLCWRPVLYLYDLPPTTEYDDADCKCHIVKPYQWLQTHHPPPNFIRKGEMWNSRKINVQLVLPTFLPTTISDYSWRVIKDTHRHKVWII